MAKALSGITQLSDAQAEPLVAAFNETDQLRGSFGFNGGKPVHHGPGLVEHLNRAGVRRFEFVDRRARIVLASSEQTGF